MVVGVPAIPCGGWYNGKIVRQLSGLTTDHGRREKQTGDLELLQQSNSVLARGDVAGQEWLITNHITGEAAVKVLGA